MSRTEQSVEVRDEGLVQSALECMRATAKILGSDFRVPSPDAVFGAFAATRDQLGHALTEGLLPESDIEEACFLLVRIEELQEQYAETAAVRRAAELRSVHDAAAGLRGLASDDIIQSAPAAICSALPFARAMISAISGSLWQPQRLHVEPEFDGSPLDFSDYVDHAEFPLSDARLETELVRRRVPALVPAPAHDERTLKEIVLASRSSSYVAAPIISRGRVIGLVHADRPGVRDPLDPDDRDRLDAFATFFALVYEQAVLRERISAQRSRLAASFDATDTVLDRMHRAELGLRPQPSEQLRSSRSPGAEISAVEVNAALTFREREILSHIATGATNSQIAQTLVISEGTVKSHVKHILKKLRVPTRAAAAVLYSHQNRR
ncbi:LuxR C-terminal-related transcriptional regulator [Rhodococcus opacus]|uniref:LuxR C-terminal-related transcriptional regulator n=1 Tax=Rhodococcus opacus TaxID=37919 RepID=UPI001C46CA12|nr:LuxR C-terminal-related transcriptional regulator [Rhodococcus opacus]MBV6755122.1 LuxR C-terminal-related transcriptional regulator [Rhodococcus opacus]